MGDHEYEPNQIVSKAKAYKAGWSRDVTDSGFEAEVSKRLREKKVEDEVQRRLQIIEEASENEYVSGDVVTFTRTYGTGKVYNYVALYVAKRWYVTGETYPKTLDELISWVFSNPDSTVELKFVGNINDV